MSVYEGREGGGAVLFGGEVVVATLEILCCILRFEVMVTVLQQVFVPGPSRLSFR